MSWVYAFRERDEHRYVKLGVAEDHYHNRFSKTQQCNPIPMEIAATWRFATTDAARLCEGVVKKGGIFTRWSDGGPEWFGVSPEEVLASEPFGKLIAENGGTYHAPLRFTGPFFETLNIGTRDKDGRRYRPHLYLITERPSTGACKLALSSYNWPTVVAHYITYNPRALSIAGRWSFPEEISGTGFFERLTQRHLSQMINPLGWFRMEADEMIDDISRSGAISYPRTSPIDDQVHYTKHRVPIR